MKQEIKRKIQSRKFIVWITSTIFVLLSMLAYFLVNDPALTRVMETFAHSWGWVSVVYIGGNVLDKKLKGGNNGLSDFAGDNPSFGGGDCHQGMDDGKPRG